MNKHLNNWLDEQEGKPENSTNNAIEKEVKRQYIPTDDDQCPNCGSVIFTWRNGSGELQCDNCGYEETSEDNN